MGRYLIMEEVVVPTVPVIPTVPVVPILPLMPLVPTQTSDLLQDDVKLHTNPWTVNDLDDFLFYCCPQCDHKTQTKSLFVNHAFLSHPESQETIKSMQNS